LHVELDSELGVIRVDGVTISLALLKTLANPDNTRTYRMRRDGDVVTVEATRGKQHETKLLL
jgi:hypothetical protein